VLNDRPSWSRYAALGDSFTEGLDDDLAPNGRHRGWADLVAIDLAQARGEQGMRYVNLAIRGRLTAQVVDEQVPVAISLGADLVSLAVGVNDALRRRFDVNATATALENGVRDLRASGSDVLLFAFGDPSRRSTVMGVIRERIRAYNSAVDAIAATYGCHTVHFWDVAAMDDDRLWSEDRLHLSPEGHRLAADCALEALGVGSSHWRTPAVPESRPAIHRRASSHARWMGGHVLPWMVRRAKGTSSGDGIAPKYPTWTAVGTGPWVAP
jgi:lysophospholipase L1-like esterase